jgi:hypothetical protein
VPFVEPTDLTTQILREMRDELRGTRDDIKLLANAMNNGFEVMNQRSEVVETTLRDLASQMVLLARLTEIEQRLEKLEKREPH